MPAAIAEDHAMPRILMTSLLAAAALAAPPAAFAADTVVAADPAAQQITALDGTIVWVSGKFGHQTLMQRTSDGTVAAVKGTRESRSYPSIDLGHDADGKLRLTYLRCDTSSSCTALWNDLDGRRASFRGLALPGCKVTTAPSQWRSRIAYGQFCAARSAAASALACTSRRGRAPPCSFRVRKMRSKFGVTAIDSVDLRGTRVAAVVADIYEYSYSQTTAGKDMHAFFAAASEGESDESARGLAIESAATHWTLTDATHSGDPDEAIIFRQTGDCLQRERLLTPAGSPQEFLATDVAVDEGQLYLLVPGTGIVTHTFTPDPDAHLRRSR